MHVTGGWWHMTAANNRYEVDPAVGINAFSLLQVFNPCPRT